jgi:hypothetical protein
MVRLCLISSLVLAAQPALAGGASGAAATLKPQPLTQLFISPMGEPFRARGGEPYPSAAWFKAADADGDGAISKAEFLADAQRFFKTLDTDGDGVLEEAEITAYETDIAPEVNIGVHEQNDAVKYNFDQYRSPDGSPAEVRVDSTSQLDSSERDAQRRRNMLASRRGAGIFGFIDMPEPVRAADTNIDFRVSLKEWMAAAAKRFDELDVKREGKLRLEALPKTPIQRANEGRR